MATSGMIPPVEDHIVTGGEDAGVAAGGGNDKRSIASTKGKAKALDNGSEDQIDPGFKVNDITNGLFSATAAIQVIDEFVLKMMLLTTTTNPSNPQSMFLHLPHKLTSPSHREPHLQ